MSSEALKRAAAHELARSDLYDFTRWMFLKRRNYKWARAVHHPTICEALMRVYRGETKRLIINVPPRYGKTEIAVINFMAWALGQVPDAEFIHTSYSARLAANNSLQTRELVLHEEYREIFPAVSLRDDSKARDEWRTTAGGCVYAVGAGGTITGYGAGKQRHGFGGCFPADELVSTEAGLIPIGDLVRKRLPLRVWSFNRATGKPELAPVDTFWTNPANRLVEVSLSDGTSFRCTPNHKIATRRGWVEARALTSSDRLPAGFAQVLHSADADVELGCRLRSGDGSVQRDGQLVGRELLSGSPLGVRQVGGHAGPGLAQLDLPDHTRNDAEALGEGRGCVEAGEDGASIFPGELGSRAALKHGDRPVGASVLHVVEPSAVGEVVQPVDGGVAVEVAYLLAVRARADERLHHELVDEPLNGAPRARQADAEVTVPVRAGLQDALGNDKGASLSALDGTRLAADAAEVAYGVEALVAGDRQPVLVREIGHAEVTYCLEVRGNHNFYVAQGQVLVSNCIIIDDPHKADEARSDVIREGVIEWFQNTLESRKNGPDTPIILIMQRLHERDLAGWLLGGGNGEAWEHVCLEAIQPDGAALWPEKHSIEELRRMEAAAPLTFAGQYMQSPSTPDGNVFKPDMIGATPVMPEVVRWVRGWDLAGTDATPGKDPDWTVGAKLGLMASGRYIIGDIVRLRGTPDAVEQAIIHTAERDGPTVHVSLPQDPGQAGKFQAAYMARQLAGLPVSTSPESGDKVTRAEPFASQVNIGNVTMVRAPWNETLISEMRVFPSGAHDDQVDALSRAFAALNERRALSMGTI